MKTLKAIFIAVTILYLGGVVYSAQGTGIGTEKYESKVLIVGKWGEKPGEYKYRPWQGDFDWPRSFAVDDNEHIYVLDYINNRVQHYDGDGKFLGTIPIESYLPASGDELKQLAAKDLGDYPSIWVKRIVWLDGVLYAIQEKRHEESILKMQDGSFVRLASAKERADVKKKLSSGSRKEELKKHFKDDKRFKATVFNDPHRCAKPPCEELSYDGANLGNAYFNKSGNNWVLDGKIIRKYDANKKLLVEIPYEGKPITVSARDGLYVLDLYTTKTGDPSRVSFEDYWEGIKISKFILVK